jgi:hypothetical protein
MISTFQLFGGIRKISVKYGTYLVFLGKRSILKYSLKSIATFNTNMSFQENKGE